MSELEDSEAILLFEALQDRIDSAGSDTEAVRRLSFGFFEIAEGRLSLNDVVQTHEDWRIVIRAFGRLRTEHGVSKELTTHLGEKITDPESRSRYYGPEWHRVREEVLLRDQARCQECGMTEPEHQRRFSASLHVHHKKPLRTFGDRSDAHARKNLVTLCASCHMESEPK